MQASEIIRRKRDGQALSPDEIGYFISRVVSGEIPDYQASAWLMAVYLRGMDEQETRALTQAFVSSGKRVDWSDLPRPSVDKHSTGGVGDKTSLIVAPLVAAAGLFVPMISGRGLAHTGGTLDKLESIPGFRSDLELKEFRSLVERTGCAIVGQTAELTPADRILYGLRDVTATVESIPLIVASIVGKKVAEGVDGLVLDVKTGRGAFMRDADEAEGLARALVRTGSELGTRAVALVTDMEQPLGRMVGNCLEVRESIRTLKGEGPGDLTHLSLELAARMLLVGEAAPDLESARELALRQLESGAGLETFARMVRGQGGADVVGDEDLLVRSRQVFEYTADSPGFVAELKADLLGRAAMLLGAGRERMDSEINHAAGLELVCKAGESVEQGQPVLKVHYDEPERLEKALAVIRRACVISPEMPALRTLIQRVID